MARAPAVAFVLAAWNLAGRPAFSGMDARPAAAAQAVAASRASAAVAGESLAPLRPAAEYVLRFRARASRPRTISLDLAQAPGPYRNLGLLRDLAIDPT